MGKPPTDAVFKAHLDRGRHVMAPSGGAACSGPSGADLYVCAFGVWTCRSVLRKVCQDVGHGHYYLIDENWTTVEGSSCKFNISKFLSSEIKRLVTLSPPRWFNAGRGLSTIVEGSSCTPIDRFKFNISYFVDGVTMDDSSSSYSDEEVGVIARGRRLWVRGVRPHTTCADVVQALRHAPEAGGACDGEGVCACASGGTQWVLAERWRGVERPLPQDACVLDVLAAWGDARHEVRLSLRRASSGEEDSGRDSDDCGRRDRKHKERRRAPTPPPRPRRQPRDPAARLAAVIQHQSRTIHQQLDKLREQEKLIDELEDQTHKNRMEKHGTNYLLESYLSDLGRCNEVNDSQAGNSDSGVGVGSGTPPRRHTKHKSRRERHLMREHYFTKELTDICQVNADRLLPMQNDTDSEASTDELIRIKEEIEILEKMAIINKRLHREEELVVRLTAKVKRYIDENRVNSCQTVPQVKTMLDKIQEELDTTTKEMQDNATELTNAECEIENRMKILEELTIELEKEESQNIILEKHLKEASSRHPIALQDNYVPLLGPSADIVLQNYSGAGYVLDTLV